VPAALEAICLKAMALKTEDRYPTALELAADVEHWLADEPVLAYREPRVVRLGRWRRRHRALVAGVTTAVLALLVTGGIGVFWLVEQGAELRKGAEAALAKAADLRREARWAEAEAVLEQASARLGEGGPPDLRRRVAQARADLRLVQRLDSARLKAATLVEGRLDRAGAEQDYASAFAQARLGQAADVVAARIRASAVRAQLVAALDDWAYLTKDRQRRAWLLAVARRADPDRWRDRFRDPKVWQDRQALQRLARLAPVRQWSPQLVTTLAGVLGAWGSDPVPLLMAAQGRHPQDFWLNFELGNALQTAKKSGAAIGYYRAPLALRPRASAVHFNLGNALRASGETDGAIACYRQALLITPREATIHYTLGNALKARGEVDGAIACYERALGLDPRYALAHNNLGIALYAKGRLDGAIACYHKALAVDPREAIAHHNLGVALKAKGDLDGAIACYRKALAVDPKFALAQNNLGIALHDKGDLDGAVACYHQALAVDPRDAQAHNNLGAALQDKGEVDRAIACWQKALALDPKYPLAHGALGRALRGQGRFREAGAACAAACNSFPSTTLGDPGPPSNYGSASARWSWTPGCPPCCRGRRNRPPRPKAWSMPASVSARNSTAPRPASMRRLSLLPRDLQRTGRPPLATTPPVPPPWPAAARVRTRANLMPRNVPACAGKRSPGCEPTWPCGPRSWPPASRRPGRLSRESCGTGRRTPTWPASATRRGWPGCRRRSA
jgi:tetratricopeptide (TPR) repeat protein